MDDAMDETEGKSQRDISWDYWVLKGTSTSVY